MRWLSIGLVIIFLLGAGFAAGRLTAPEPVPEIPETFVDLAAATPEFREQMKDQQFVKFISSVKFSGEIPGRPSDTPTPETLDLPEGTPSFPVAPMYKAGEDLAWPDVEDEALKAEFDQVKDGWVIVNIWASWCAPCVAEMPDMDAAHPRYDDLGISLITINADPTGKDDFSTVEMTFGKRGVQTLAPLLAKDSDIDAIASAFGMSRTTFSLPNNILYAPGGVPVATFTGGAMGNDAHWNTDEAIAVLKAVMETHAGQP